MHVCFYTKKRHIHTRQTRMSRSGPWHAKTSSRQQMHLSHTHTINTLIPDLHTHVQIRSMACKDLETADASQIRRALVLAFTLKSSSYATMCIREVLKEHSEESSLGLREVNAPAVAAGEGDATGKQGD